MMIIMIMIMIMIMIIIIIIIITLLEFPKCFLKLIYNIISR